MAIGSVWKAGSWADTAWAPNTWADAAPVTVALVLDDLTTVFIPYLEDLRDASLQARLDTTTEVTLDLPDVYAAVANDDDLNTALAIYLS